MDLNTNNNVVTVQPVTNKDPAISSLSGYMAGLAQIDNTNKKMAVIFKDIDSQIDEVQKGLDEIDKLSPEDPNYNEKVLELLAMLEKKISNIEDRMKAIYKAIHSGNLDVISRNLQIALLKNQIDAQREQQRLNEDLLSQQKAEPTIK